MSEQTLYILARVAEVLIGCVLLLAVVIILVSALSRPNQDTSYRKWTTLCADRHPCKLSESEVRYVLR